jgi:uncharacterized protein YecE (DUF72 family)
MDFGRVDNLKDVDFTFPDDHPVTDKLLKSLKKKKKRHVYVGCAKWGRPEWVGKIYPPKTKAAKFRDVYVKQYNSLELNSTFYGMPKPDNVKSWTNDTPKEFKYCPKFSQVITHYRRLKDCEDVTKEYLKAMGNLGDNLGNYFLQFPDNFGPANFERLKEYLDILPEDINLNIEFRHKDWFTDTPESDAVFKELKDRGIGTVITDTAGRRDLVHQRLTNNSCFIRFVGNSLHKTDYTRVDDWVDRIGKWYDAGLDNIYFFMHMHDERYSPELSLYTIKKLNKRLGTDLKEPEFYNDKQGKLL